MCFWQKAVLITVALLGLQELQLATGPADAAQQQLPLLQPEQLATDKLLGAAVSEICV